MRVVRYVAAAARLDPHVQQQERLRRIELGELSGIVPARFAKEYEFGKIGGERDGGQCGRTIGDLRARGALQVLMMVDDGHRVRRPQGAGRLRRRSRRGQGRCEHRGDRNGRAADGSGKTHLYSFNHGCSRATSLASPRL